MMLHEIGHIVGCDHVGGTIMAVDLARMITAGGPESVYGQIDGYASFVTDWAGNQVWKGIMSGDSHVNPKARSQQFFTMARSGQVSVLCFRIKRGQ